MNAWYNFLLVPSQKSCFYSDDMQLLYKQVASMTSSRSPHCQILVVQNTRSQAGEFERHDKQHADAIMNSSCCDHIATIKPSGMMLTGEDAVEARTMWEDLRYSSPEKVPRFCITI
jgi:hypothetical protein